MTHAFTMWLGRLLFATRPLVQPLPAEQPPMKIEVERLPDYCWRELGFPPSRRPDME